MRSTLQPDYLKILRGLSNGADPFTGEILSADSPLNKPQVIRALFWAIERCGQNKSVSIQFNQTKKKSVEERQRENMQRGLPQNTGLNWKEEARREVADSFRSGISITAIARKQLRTRGSITSELKRQGLISDNSEPKV